MLVGGRIFVGMWSKRITDRFDAGPGPSVAEADRDHVAPGFAVEPGHRAFFVLDGAQGFEDPAQGSGQGEDRP